MVNPRTKYKLIFVIAILFSSRARPANEISEKALPASRFFPDERYHCYSFTLFQVARAEEETPAVEEPKADEVAADEVAADEEQPEADEEETENDEETAEEETEDEENQDEETEDEGKNSFNFVNIYWL